MPSPPFDPTRSVRFDLARGTVVHADARHLLVPAIALEALAKLGTEACNAVAREMGAAIGKQVATKLGAVKSATLEAFVAHLGGELAVSGHGALSIERWGRAMVIVLEHTPLPAAFVAPMLAATLEAAAGRNVTCTVLARDATTTRVLVSSERASKRVQAWLEEKVAWGEALTRLHTRPDARVTGPDANREGGA